ncbi:MAG: membrane protein of unknown function [Promethearchaeota archaeon]|nr:MAG: membrane protein of unknown function [Candidatus Lokiarchaeota archaeon]
MIFIGRDILLNDPTLMVIGVSTLIFLSILVLLAITMIYKGFKNKNRLMFYISAIFIGGMLAWSGVGLNFSIALIFDNIPPDFVSFMIQQGFIGIFLFLWTVGVTDLTNIKRKTRKTLLIAIGTFLALFQVFYWIILFYDISLLGTVHSVVVQSHQPLDYLYLSISLGFFVVGAAWITIESYNSSDSRIKLKSRFLLLFIVLISVGGFIEIFNNIIFGGINIIGALISKIFLTFGIISGYLGFILPLRVEQIVMKFTTKSVNV